MSSMDNLLQQLEKRNAERMPLQGPSDLSQHQGDGQSCKQSVALNGSPKLLDNFSSDKLIRTIESVGGIKSYEFLNNEKSQSLNSVNDAIDFARNEENVSGDMQKMESASGGCTASNIQHTLNQNQQHIDDSESKSISGAGPLHHPAKLKKQDAVDFENISANEHPDRFPDSSLNTLRHSSNICDQDTDPAIPEQNTPLNPEDVDLIDEGHHAAQNEVTDVPTENNSPGEHLQNLENLSPDVNSSELLYTEDNEDDHSSNLPDSSRRESSDEKDILRFTNPHESPVVTGWKLDRRESGHLFWRRDSSTLNGVDPSSRVKFRYDIEVREIESTGSETEDLLEEDEKEQDDGMTMDSEEKVCKESSDSNSTSAVTTEETSSIPLSIVSFFAIFAIVVSLLYSWFTYLYFFEHVDETQKN